MPRQDRVTELLHAWSAVVNEAYLRLMDVKRLHWHDRAHFYAIAARVMRRILVDRARRRGARKRGDDPELLQIDEAGVIAAKPSYDLLALDEALDNLETLDPRKARVVELRFFTGLTVEESAVALGVSPETVKRDWRLAKAWLSSQLAVKGETK
jgi:RNA polymerase sigma factor (TIGR02999 family)